MPVTTGLDWVVVLSPAGGVSDDGSSVGADGVAGAVPSIVICTVDETALLLPALSSAAAAML